jgi:hypothetical protein
MAAAIGRGAVATREVKAAAGAPSGSGAKREKMAGGGEPVLYRRRRKMGRGSRRPVLAHAAPDVTLTRRRRGAGRLIGGVRDNLKFNMNSNSDPTLIRSKS